MHAVSLALLAFFAYAFLGWVLEIVSALVVDRTLRNPGFLTGPVVPIYGVGAIAIVLLIDPFVDNPFLVFLASVAVTTAIELVTHVLLEKLLHVKLWDYSARRFNFQGRICAENSLFFGILALLVVYVLQPALSSLLGLIPEAVAIAIAFSLIGVLVVDFGNSVWSMLRTRPQIRALARTFTELRERTEAQFAQLHDLTEDIQHAARRRGRDLQRWNLERLESAFPNARLVPFRGRDGEGRRRHGGDGGASTRPRSPRAPSRAGRAGGSS